MVCIIVSNDYVFNSTKNVLWISWLFTKHLTIICYAKILTEHTLRSEVVKVQQSKVTTTKYPSLI